MESEKIFPWHHLGCQAMTPFGARMVWVPFTGGQQNMGETARQLLVEDRSR